MYIHISRHVRVFITEKQHLFIHKWQNHEHFLQSELPIEEAVIAKTTIIPGAEEWTGDGVVRSIKAGFAEYKTM